MMNNINTIDTLKTFLNSEKFNNGLSIKWNFANSKLTSRLQYLAECCKGKKVIHLGCLDHNKETIIRKIADNTWLHKVLTDVSAQCLGIDINPSLTHEIKEELGIDNIICSDLSKDDVRAEITAQQWDYLVCGEIIEHIDNPVHFLSEINKKYAANIKRIIVTVPNSLNLGHVKRAFKTVESINTDHRYSFTPYNILKIMAISGYHSTKIDMTLHFDPKTRGPINRFILKRFPLLRSDIIVEADF
jgi:hypothetical protein